MKRKSFLQGLGLSGVAAIIPDSALKAANKTALGRRAMPPNCTIIPTETAGPFPLDLTENPTFFRQDIREGKAGVPLRLKLKIIGASNCLPMPNVRVNIWHCDKDGNYSGYGTQTGLTDCRGYQMADANGEVEFLTIFPGWYNGRIVHIHFQVYVSSIYKAISQLSFPLAARDELYATHASLYTKGPDPKTFNTDGIFADGYAFQVATLTPNASGGYDSYLEVTVNGSGVSGLAEAEPETGGQFKLGQNYPNPFVSETNIPFKLTNTSEVQIDFFNVDGRKMGSIQKGELLAGDYSIPVNLKALGLPVQNYIYQLQVKNNKGVFRQCKMMTSSK